MSTASAEEELGALLARIQPDDMSDAIATVRARLRRGDDPELRLLYGELALAACDFPTACRQLEAAVVEFRTRGLRRRAAVAASYLARVHTEGWGNRVVGRAWLRRAHGLLTGEPPCVEQGWVAVALLGCDVPDTEDLEASAGLALELARRFGDVRLEVRALAEAGLAMVSAGAVEAGMTQLEEAMTTATGGEVDPLVTLLAGCCMVTACERAGDLVRAEAWLAGPERMGLTGPALHLTVAHCAATVGTLLREVGRWEEAERVLTRAIEAGERTGRFSSRMGCQVAMAALRVQQGRLEEAAELLAGFEDRVEAMAPLANLHLARAEYDLAAAVACRGIRMLHGDRMRAAPLLLSLVSAELGHGDVAAAGAAARQLEEVARQAGQPTVLARAALATARVAAARVAGAGERCGDSPEECLNQALFLLGESLPLLRAAIHLALARWYHCSGLPHAAAAEARAALAIHTRLGAPPSADDAQLLHSLVPPAAVGVPGQAALSRDGAYWTVRHGQVAARLPDTKGMRYLADLLARPGAERHVFDLVDLVEGVPDQPGLDRRRLGDAGPHLDATARQHYRRRLLYLREHLHEAEACGNHGAADEAQAEMDALAGELARAVGLTGHDRRAASSAEKARLNVTRALRTAINRIQATHPQLGQHLHRHIRTGAYCGYQPPPETAVAWSITT